MGKVLRKYPHVVKNAIEALKRAGFRNLYKVPSVVAPMARVCPLWACLVQTFLRVNMLFTPSRNGICSGYEQSSRNHRSFSTGVGRKRLINY
ncbi:MAG: hypothetical protein R2778_05375 [Saprospiraceae bacterium]